MKHQLDERVKNAAEYIIEKKVTIRQTANRFKISKSTVHKDVTERLWNIDRSLYEEVRKILDFNKSQRAIRGGLATKRKYKK